MSSCLNVASRPRFVVNNLEEVKSVEAECIEPRRGRAQDHARLARLGMKTGCLEQFSFASRLASAVSVGFTVSGRSFRRHRDGQLLSLFRAISYQMRPSVLSVRN